MPPCLRVVDMSACVNGWNSFADCSRVMPMPVSRTENLSCTFSPVRSSCSMLSRISPRSVNLTALLTQLVRIWPRRSGSPSRLLRNAGRDVHQELESLFVRLLRGQRRDGADDFIELEVGGFDVELAGLDLGEVEDVVDDRQQRRAGIVDLADVVALLGRQLRLEGEMREADDGVHRRADLVAHVREEHGFHLGGFLGLPLGADQFLRLFLELARLSLRLAEQLLRAQVALQDFQAHRHDRQQFVEQRLLLRVERAEGRHFEHAEQRVLGQRRQRHRLERRGLAEAGGDAEVIRRKIRERDDLSLAARTGQPTPHRAGSGWRSSEVSARPYAETRCRCPSVSSNT